MNRLLLIDDDVELCELVAHIEERIAGHERQRSDWGRREHRQVVGLDNLGADHTVIEGPASCRHPDLITFADILQRSEECVAVTGDDRVALFPWECGVGEMSDGPCERCVVITFHDDDRHVEARNLEPAPVVVSEPAAPPPPPVQTAPPPAVVQTAPPPPVQAAPVTTTRTELPRTAGSTALLALVGALALSSGFALAILRRRAL